MILAHSHPSGNQAPSNADKIITEKITQSAGFMDIKVLDHLIITNETYLSFSDEGPL
jgi:DNA repair protein RadC